MDSGISSLRPLFDYAENDFNCEALDGDGEKGLEFGRMVSDVVQEIPDSPGFFLWGRFESNKAWRNIFLGHSGNLKANIREQISDNRASIYSFFQNEKPLIKKCVEYFNGRYWHQWLDAIERLRSATYIAWCVSTHAQDTSIRALLIEIMNPITNINRPLPSSGFDKSPAIEVIQNFNRVITTERLSGCFFLGEPRSIQWYLKPGIFL